MRKHGDPPVQVIPAQRRSTTRTPLEPAITAACASPMNKPCSTTPAMPSRRSGERFRIGDPLECGIENPVPAVRDESVAILGPPQQRWAGASGGGRRGFDRSPGRGQSERHHLDRQREAAERRYPFRFIGNDDHARGSRGHDLFPQQRAAAALDQAQIGGDLVGAVDGQIEFRRLVEAGQRHAQPLGVAASRFRRGHRDHVEAGADALGQKLDEMLGGRAGAEAEPHARAHEFDGTGGGSTFLGLDVHRDRGVRLGEHRGCNRGRLSSAVRRAEHSPFGRAASAALPSRSSAASDREEWLLPPSSSILTERWSTARPISSPRSTSSSPAKVCRRSPTTRRATWSAAARAR